MASLKYLQSKRNIFKITVFIIVLVLWSVVLPITAFFWTVFLVWWVFRLDSRILGWVAIGFLVLVPVTLHFHLDARAEQIAVYVYYLLVMVVVLQIIELRREGSEEPLNIKSVAVPEGPARKTGRAVQRPILKDIRYPKIGL